MLTTGQLAQLPLEILEIIGEHLPAQSYCNLREVCRNTACLGPVAKLNFKAFQESAKGWTAANGRTFEKLYSCEIYDEADVFKDSDLYENDKLIMNHFQLKVSEYSPTAFIWMSENYIGEEVMRMIRCDPSILDTVSSDDLEECQTFPLNWACTQGYLDVVETLLKVSWIDPSIGDEFGFGAIDFACRNGHLEVAKLLLQDSRVDPSGDNNYIIGIASRYGSEVVKLLLQDTRVDPSADENYAIRWASHSGHSEAVRLLLQDSRVDPTANDNGAVRKAFENGHVETVKLLLRDPRVGSLMMPFVGPKRWVDWMNLFRFCSTFANEFE